MNKLLSCFAVLLFLITTSHLDAQIERTALKTIATAGTSTISGGLSVSYTVGQSAFAHITGSGQTMNAGFQQVFCIPSLDTIEQVVCQGSLFDKGDFDKASSYIAGDFVYSFTGVNAQGCDSMVCLKLSVKPTNDTDVYHQAEDCYSWGNRMIDSSGIYNDTVLNLSGCDSVVRLHLILIHDMPLPVIYSYEDKALVCPHVSADGDSIYYFGYRWMRNDKSVSTSLKEAFYQPMDGSLLDGCYHLEVAVDSSLEIWVSSNTLCFGSAAIGNVESDFSFSYSPNPISSGRMLSVDVNAEASLLNNAKLSVYDIQGRKIYHASAFEHNTLQASFPAGVYSIHISLSDGRVETHKLIVR